MKLIEIQKIIKIRIIVNFINIKEAEFTQSHDREMLQEMFDEDGLIDSDL